MPAYQAPRSDEGRLSTLEAARDTATKDIAAGRKSITQETLDAITAFAALFRPLWEALAGALSGRMKEVREREEARAQLDTYVRDFWEVLKRRAHRLKQPAEILVQYGLPSDGIIPNPTTFEDLMRAADQIVKGEAEAIAAGYPAMANPSAAEVAAIRDAAKVQAADVPTADRKYTGAQQAIAARREEADGLIDDVMADLTSSLRKYDKPTQRRIMRTYGAVYVALEGEPPDEEQPGAAVAPTITGEPATPDTPPSA